MGSRLMPMLKEIVVIQPGIEFDREKNEFFIDLHDARTLTVRATNDSLAIEKIYILKITPRGICLV